MRAEDHAPRRDRSAPAVDGSKTRTEVGPETGSTPARKELERFWDTNRAYYDQAAAANPEASPERQRLFAQLDGTELVLDLGAGSCENALWLPAGCRYVGCDVSTTALVMAAEKDRPGARLRSDACRLPIATGSVDAVLTTWALEHFHEPGNTLLEAVRVLKPGGLLLLVGSTWDLPYEIPPSLSPRDRPLIALKRLRRQLASWLDRKHRFDQVREPRVLTDGYVPDADAVHVAQSWQVVRFLKDAGLDIVHYESLPHAGSTGKATAPLRALLRWVPLWRRGWGNLFLVARRGAELHRPPYRLLPL